MGLNSLSSLELRTMTKLRMRHQLCPRQWFRLNRGQVAHVALSSERFGVGSTFGCDQVSLRQAGTQSVQSSPAPSATCKWNDGCS